MVAVPRLLFVHAHPDDETLTTGATIAHYAARGAQVHVLTCTLGEEGEVIGDRYARLTVEHADQLGGYRIGELTAALAALGAAPPRFLGGAGRWRDSGMVGTAARRQPRFVDADPAEVTEALAAVICEIRPHVVVCYDPRGGYGHPDHIQVHTVTAAAVAAAADPARGAGAWATPKLYWTVTSQSALAAGIAALDVADLAPGWAAPAVDPALITFPDERIDAVIDAGPAALAAKVAALRAHATQVSVGPSGRAFALSNGLAQPVLAAEHYILAAGRPGERDARGFETDLVAGVALNVEGAL